MPRKPFTKTAIVSFPARLKIRFRTCFSDVTVGSIFFLLSGSSELRSISCYRNQTLRLQGSSSA